MLIAIELIFLGIIIKFFFGIRQLFHVKKLCVKISENLRVQNGRTDFLVKIIEFYVAWVGRSKSVII